MDENIKHQVAAKLTEIFFAAFRPAATEFEGEDESERPKTAHSRRYIFDTYKGFLQELDQLSEDRSGTAPTGTLTRSVK
jgi:hypothetical protein